MFIVSFRELLICGYAKKVSRIVVFVTYIIVYTHTFFQTAVIINKPLFCFLSDVFVVNLSTKISFPRSMVNLPSTIHAYLYYNGAWTISLVRYNILFSQDVTDDAFVL